MGHHQANNPRKKRRSGPGSAPLLHIDRPESSGKDFPAPINEQARGSTRSERRSGVATAMVASVGRSHGFRPGRDSGLDRAVPKAELEWGARQSSASISKQAIVIAAACFTAVRRRDPLCEAPGPSIGVAYSVLARGPPRLLPSRCQKDGPNGWAMMPGAKRYKDPSHFAA